MAHFQTHLNILTTDTNRELNNKFRDFSPIPSPKSNFSIIKKFSYKYRAHFQTHLNILNTDTNRELNNRSRDSSLILIIKQFSYKCRAHFQNHFHILTTDPNREITNFGITDQFLHLARNLVSYCILRTKVGRVCQITSIS